MNQDPNDKLADDFKKVESILDRAKADLMNLLQDFEPPKAAAVHAEPEGKGAKSHVSWLRFPFHTHSDHP